MTTITSALSAVFRGIVLTTQIIGILSGFILALLICKESFKNEYNIIMLLMTVGLLIFNIIFMVFVFENLYDNTISWLFIIGVTFSICSYFLSVLLSYSVYSLLVYREYTYLWDVKNMNFKFVIFSIFTIVGISCAIGILQFYSPVLADYSALPLFGLFSKVTFAICSLILYVKSEFHIRMQLRGDTNSLDERLLKTRNVVTSMRLYPLLQLICILPLFITSLYNNLQVVEIHTLKVTSSAFAGFAFSYAILYLDLFFMLIVYLLLNKEAVYHLKNIFCCGDGLGHIEDENDNLGAYTEDYESFNDDERFDGPGRIRRDSSNRAVSEDNSDFTIPNNDRAITFVNMGV